MRNKQQGFATLAASLMLMFLITFNVFIGSKGSLIEQRSANNGTLAEIAFEHAEKGLAEISLALKKAFADNPTAPTTSLAPTEIKDAAGNVLAIVTYTNGVITSVGKAGTAGTTTTKTITQRVTVVPSSPPVLSVPVPDALTALGNIALGGSVDVSTVKAGGTVSLQDNATKVGGSNTVSGNTAIQQNVGTYAGMSPDDYFMYYFGNLCPVAKGLNKSTDCQLEARATISNKADGYVCLTNCGSVNLSDAYWKQGKRIFWLEAGGIDIGANIILGNKKDEPTCTKDSAGQMKMTSCIAGTNAAYNSLGLGAKDEPVLIFVMNGGTVSLNGTSKMYGILYVDAVTTETVPCKCEATATVATDINEVLAAHYTTVGGAACTSNGGCAVPTCSGADAYTPVGANGKVPETAIVPVCVPQKTTWVSKTWNTIEYSWVDNTRQQCKDNKDSCQVDVNHNKCDPTAKKIEVTHPVPNSTAKASCSYDTIAVNGSSNTPVQIEIKGTWDLNGTGNALIEGAAVTSGNVKATGGSNFVSNPATKDNFTEATAGGVTVDIRGWTD